MAEPMGSKEIEDVLSSIRRLVAQDLKPADRVRLAAVADISNKLVLSPEDRVVAQDGAAKFVTVRRPSRRAAFPAIDEVLPNMDGASGGQLSGASDKDWSLGAVGADEFVAPQPDTFSVDPNLRLSQMAPQAFETTFDAQSDDKSDHSADFDRALAALPPQDYEEQEYEEDVSELTAQSMHDWPEDTQEAIQPQSFHGTIEPDADWANEAEARVLAELAGEAVEEAIVYHAQQRAEPSFVHKSASIATALYDEDELRKLIQTLFREEMSGPMGERITRNIRKLVRAEVGRMLAAQELQ
jgi:hypothetical protein